MVENDTEKLPRLLTTKELSRELSLPMWRIYELVKQGKGPPRMLVGKTWRFPADQVRAWIIEQSEPKAG